MFQPIGSDTWTYDLGLKHGMRDGLTCPVGGRWVVVFWSRKELSNIVTQPPRIMIGVAASIAALRLNQLAIPHPNIFVQHAQLTPRELAVRMQSGWRLRRRNVRRWHIAVPLRCITWSAS
jgi:hypothetical protein